VKVKCPKCNSDDFDLGDYTHHAAYDDVVDSISDDGSFRVWAHCNKCDAIFWIRFDITALDYDEEETKDYAEEWLE